MGKSKGEYTINEILTQHELWTSVITSVESKGDEVLPLFKDIERVIFTGCGSNYYMSLGAAIHFRFLTGIPSSGIPASELLLYPRAVFGGVEKALVVSLCRSGETTEVVKAINLVRKSTGFNTLYIGCYPQSTVAQLCTRKIALPEAQEKSIVTTKSHTAMFLAVQMIAGMLHTEVNITGSAYVKELKSLPEIGKRIIENLRERVKDMPLERYKQFVFLGSGPFYGIACESMLKMKEMALVPSDSFHSLEFRHGPKSILGEDVLVSIFLSDTAREYEAVLIREIKQLGGSVMVVCEKADSSIPESSDYLIEIESNLGEFSRSAILLPVSQLLAFYKALSKNIDVDSPRNLTYYVSL